MIFIAIADCPKSLRGFEAKFQSSTGLMKSRSMAGGRQSRPYPQGREAGRPRRAAETEKWCKVVKFAYRQRPEGAHDTSTSSAANELSLISSHLVSSSEICTD